MLFKLAWRNIWRNRRRTFITVASILFAVMLAALMEALQKGAWDNMISNVVNFYYGYVQVHEKGYWDEQSIDKSFAYVDSVKVLEEEVPEIKTLIPRVESFALASTPEKTFGVMVVGVDPEKENRMTSLASRISKGAYFENGDKTALMAEGVAKKLEIGVGDTLVLISQGYRGVNSAGKYPVRGLVHFGSPELNNRMVYLPLDEAQWFYGAEGRLTSLALHLEDQDDMLPAVNAVKAKLSTEAYEVMDWEELLPDLVEARTLDSAGNYIVYFILYIIIAFGIYGTILMMTKEREYEFGILVSIGMHRWRLAAVIWMETMMLGLMGALAGILASFPVVYYFYVNPIRFSGDYGQMLEKFGFEPIFPAIFEPRVFVLQAVIVFIITSVLALYPIWKIHRLKPVEAMRR
jgi:putative ABC transport system permease protein